MSWEPDTEENRLGKVRKELEDLKAQTSFLNTPINNDDFSNSLGSGFGQSSFNQGAMGDVVQEVTNVIETHVVGVDTGLIGLFNAIGSFFTIKPQPSSYPDGSTPTNPEPTANTATIKQIRSGVNGQKITLKPQEGINLALINNSDFTKSSELGNLFIGSDIILTGTELITLRFTTEKLYSDNQGCWVVDSTSSGSGSSTSGVLKDPVKVATTANVTNLNFSSPIDGIAMTVGDRFLVKNQTAQKDNGIYIWANGSASTRASDMSNGSVQKEGTMTYVQDGLTQNEILYAINIGGNNITIGTNPNTWGEIGSGSGGGSGAIKSPVKYATTANITLSGEQSIDGTATSTSRVLVKNQTTSSQNGIYVTATGAWARSTDMSTGSTIEGGTMVYVTDGTVNGDNLFGLTTEGTVTVGTGNQAWANLTGSGWVGTATSDLNMSTYDILNVDRLKFDTTGSAVLTNTTAGINATADEMHLNVPDNDDFKFTVHNNTRFLITDTSTHIYTENGGANFERLRIDNTDAWFYGIALTPTTNTQLIGGSSTNEQWSNVYGNKLSILNNSSNVTTTTQGAVFTNATNGLTLKSPDLSGTNFGSATFTDKDGANRVEFNYDMSANDGNAVFNYMRKGFKIRTNNADTDALLIYPRQNSFATNDVIIDAVDSSANGSISMKINSSERFRISMTDTTIKASTTGEINMTQPLNMSGGSSGSTHYNTIKAGSVLPKSYGYTLGASGSGLVEKGWDTLYLTTSGSNADRGKITLNDYGNTYIQLTNTGYGLKLISNDNLQMSSVGSTLVTAGSGNTITFMAGAGSATHTFQNNALSLGSGIDLAVNANLIDFTNRSTPTSSLFNDGAMYSKNVSGTTTPMWWDGTTETSMLGGGGGGSSGGVNSSYIWTNDETNEYDEKVYLSNATMGSSSGTNSIHARLTRNYTYYIPIYFSKACTITEIGYECTISGGSGVTLRYGLYSNRTDNQNYPYQLLDGGGGSDIIYLSSSIGATKYPMSFTRTLSVPSAGLFWVAINNTNNTSTTFRVEGGDVGGVNTVGHVYNSFPTPDHFEPIQAFKESESGNFNSTADDDNQSIGYGDSANRAPIIFVRVE
jgi:hypothetical protein